MLDDELQLVRQGWLWKGGKTFGQYTQKRRHFLLVRPVPGSTLACKRPPCIGGETLPSPPPHAPCHGG